MRIFKGSNIKTKGDNKMEQNNKNVNTHTIQR